MPLDSTKWDLCRNLGNAGERLVATFLNCQGWGVIPSYEFSGKDNQKAPRLIFANCGLTIPDLDVSRDGKRKWVEVKTYHGAVLNNREKRLVHGIASRLFKQYIEVEKQTGTEVFIAVLEYMSGELLIASLAHLNTPNEKGVIDLWPCMCPACRQQQPSHCQSVGIPNGLYWPRNKMKTIQVFTDADLAEVRMLAQRIKGEM